MVWLVRVRKEGEGEDIGASGQGHILGVTHPIGHGGSSDDVACVEAPEDCTTASIGGSQIARVISEENQPSSGGHGSRPSVVSVGTLQRNFPLSFAGLKVEGAQEELSWIGRNPLN